jgi:chitosanase
MAGALVMILVAFGATWHLGRVHGAQVEERTREPVASGNAAQGDHDRVRCSSAASADPSSPAGETLVLSMVASAENSTLRWEQQVGYLEYNVEGNAAENRGYTGGIVGFTSKTHDMLELVRAYDAAAPGNPLSPYLPALADVDGSSRRTGLGSGFEQAWASAAKDERFLQAQVDLTRKLYLQPAVALAKADRVGPLGQFAYVDAAVMHGLDDAKGLGRIRRDATAAARPPAQGGDEKAYLDAFLDARVATMKTEKGHKDTTRVNTAQRVFLDAGNLALDLPLEWKTYGDRYTILATDECARRGIKE